MQKRYALLADIHANVWALDAVINDAKNLGVMQFINLGDILYGPLAPTATFERLKSLNVMTIQGNQDRMIWQATVDDIQNNETLNYVINDLSVEALDWLKNLPGQLDIDDEIYACHGAPDDDMIYLLEDISSGQPILKKNREISHYLNDVMKKVVLCAHTHIPRCVQLDNGQLVINPGSVGLPAYDDDAPVFHKMENGSPHARYAIIENTPQGWIVEQRAIPYDHHAAADQAKKIGRPDWEIGIRTGLMG